VRAFVQANILPAFGPSKEPAAFRFMTSARSKRGRNIQSGMPISYYLIDDALEALREAGVAASDSAVKRSRR
jgi:hypothetical protein